MQPPQQGQACFAVGVSAALASTALKMENLATTYNGLRRRHGGGAPRREGRLRGNQRKVRVWERVPMGCPRYDRTLALASMALALLLAAPPRALAQDAATFDERYPTEHSGAGRSRADCKNQRPRPRPGPQSPRENTTLPRPGASRAQNPRGRRLLLCRARSSTPGPRCCRASASSSTMPFRRPIPRRTWCKIPAGAWAGTIRHYRVRSFLGSCAQRCCLVSLRLVRAAVPLHLQGLQSWRPTHGSERRRARRP